jgi:hypothetical protein
MQEPKVEELMLQSLETALGAGRVYEAALACAVHKSLREDWEAGLEHLRRHASALRLLCKVLHVDPDRDTAVRRTSRLLIEALVTAIQSGKKESDAMAAQLLASEAITLADAKHRINCALIEQCGRYAPPAVATALQAGCDELSIAKELRHRNEGWCRELRAYSVRLPAMLPPPEYGLIGRAASH